MNFGITGVKIGNEVPQQNSAVKLHTKKRTNVPRPTGNKVAAIQAHGSRSRSASEISKTTSKKQTAKERAQVAKDKAAKEKKLKDEAKIAKAKLLKEIAAATKIQCIGRGKSARTLLLQMTTQEKKNAQKKRQDAWRGESEKRQEKNKQLLLSLQVHKDATAINAALFEMVAEGSQVEVEKLLADGADVNTHDTNGETAFSEAACMGNEKVVQILLRRGCLFDTRNLRGRTPLWRSAYNGHSSIVKILLEAGADINVYDDSGRSPADVSPPETRDIIKEEDQKRESIKTESGNDFDDMERWRTFLPAQMQLSLIAKGELNEHQRKNVASKSKENSQSQKIIELLEDLWDNEDINLEYRDFEQGHTPLLNAVISQQLDVAKLLLKLGCDPNGASFSMTTPLMVAASKDNANMVQLLLDSGAIVYAVNKTGTTAFEAAKSLAIRRVLAKADPFSDCRYPAIMAKMQTQGMQGPKRDEQTKRLLQMTGVELREGGEEYRQLLEQRELKAIVGMS